MALSFFKRRKRREALLAQYITIEDPKTTGVINNVHSLAGDAWHDSQGNFYLEPNGDDAA